MPDFAKRLIPLAILRIDETKTEHSVEAAWSDSDSICRLSDAERHLGYILKAGNYWLAYDVTHLNDMGKDFRLLGTFRNVMTAKRAVERELHCVPSPHREAFSAAGAAIS